MKQAEIDAIKVRCEKATPGPWKWDHHGNDVYFALIGRGGCVFSAEPDAGISGDLDGADAEFIKMAREDIPRLVEEAERLRGMLREALDELASLRLQRYGPGGREEYDGDGLLARMREALEGEKSNGRP